MGTFVLTVAWHVEHGWVDGAGGVGVGDEGDVVLEHGIHHLVVAARGALTVNVPRVCRRHRPPLGPPRTRPSSVGFGDGLHADQTARETPMMTWSQPDGERRESLLTGSWQLLQVAAAFFFASEDFGVR